jgi:G8 domain
MEKSLRHPNLSPFLGHVLTIAAIASMALPAAAQSGNTCPVPPSTGGVMWSSPATWGGAVPAAGAAVIIPAGQRVVLDVTPPPLKSLTIEGQLAFDPNQDLNLTAESIIAVGRGATFEIGAAAKPYLKRATITLTGSNAADNIMGMGTKVLGATTGARIEIHGEPRVSWTQLAATANAGASVITTAAVPDWRVGERIAIASTAFNPDEAEVRTITAVSGNQITLDKPLLYRHYGELQTFEAKVLDARAEVGLLSRNIVIAGDAASTAANFGGHMMIMGHSGDRYTESPNRGAARISGVEFRRMGQLGKLGRYPLHWHLNGPSPGDFIKNSVIADTIQRGIVVHGTDGVTVENNVAHNTRGHSYVVENGTERDNVLRGNLGIRTLAFTAKAADPLLAAQNDDQAATFWMKAGDNRWFENRAAGGEHTAFWFDDVGTVDTARFEFRDNAAHSYLIDERRTGDMCCSFEKAALWFTGEGYDKPYRGPFTLTNVTVYKSRVAMWGNPLTVGQGFADVRLSDSIIADNIMGINSHGARNTVIVGKSANTDAIDSIGAQGIQEYGHTQRLDNVTFVNFGAGSSAIYHRNCAREAGNVTATSVRLVNSVLNLCAYQSSTDSDYAVADKTGTILGSGRPVTLTPVQNAARAMYTTDCAKHPSQQVRVCDGLLGYSNLHQRGANAALLRDDGITLDVSAVDNYPFYWTTIEGRRYTLQGDVANQPTIEFTMMVKFEDDNQDRSLVVSVPATSAFAISGVNTDWFSPTSRTGATALPQAASLAALTSSSVSAYFYDTGARMIHLKLWTNGKNRVFVDRR